VALCAVMLFFDGFDNQIIAYVAPALTQAWHLGRGAFGPVFTIGVAGVAIGTLVSGPMADRFGRRPLVIGTMIWFSVLTIATTRVGSVSELSILRFLAGLGIGGIVPIAVVVISEFAPRRTRARLITVASCGYALGAASGGLLAAQIIPLFGWTSVFWVGGIAPLILVLLLLAWLPESVRLLALRPDTAPRIARTLRAVDPALSFPDDVQFTVAREAAQRRIRVVQLFTDGRAGTTILIWFIFFMNVGSLGLLNNWLPTLVNATGLAQNVALRVASALQLGGIVGVICMGILADRFGFYRVLSIGSLIAAIFIGMVSSVGASVFLLASMIAVAGFFNIGCQLTEAALCATLYPTDIRSTGVNWAHGVARSLSSVWPLFAGMLLEFDVPLRDIFIIIAFPLLLASGAIIILAAIRRARPDALTLAGKASDRIRA
jgi:AAHS family 4-hydroxybenzoate transporter-like MFS transporter